MSLPEWGAAFKKQTVDVAAMDVEGISYEESAQRLRGIVKSGLLRHTDLVQHPERFFLAHRLLAGEGEREERGVDFLWSAPSLLPCTVSL